MAATHAEPGEILDLVVPEAATATLVRTPSLQVVRLTVPAGYDIPNHAAPGDITVHCLTGAVDFTAVGHTRRLAAGQLLYLPAGGLHALRGVEAATVLVTLARGGQEVRDAG